MSEPWDQTSLALSMPSVVDFHVRTSLAQERALALLAVARAFGLSLNASSAYSDRSGLSSRTSQAGRSGGLTKSRLDWGGRAMTSYRSRCRQAMSALRTCDDEYFLLPTPTASTYGSNQGGASGRTGQVRHSLHSMAKKGLLPTPTARDWRNGKINLMGKNSRPLNEVLANHGTSGHLSPQFVEWMMGFPIGWTELER